MEQATLDIEVVDLDGKPQEGLAFQIKAPDGNMAQGKLDKKSHAQVKSSTPGIFVVTFPDLDGADWDGDGALELPPEEDRSEASRHTVKQGERMATIAPTYGFRNWETIWNYARNTDIRNTRGDPNVLRAGDEFSIPTKLARTAEVQGGLATYVIKSDDRPWVFNLWIRLDISPNESSACNDKFCLTATDGTVETEKTVADDQVPNDDSIDLLFENLDGDKSYSLKVKTADVEYFAFKGVSGWELHNMHEDGIDDPADEGNDSATSDTFDDNEEDLP
jgi:hypothetical protein